MSSKYYYGNEEISEEQYRELGECQRIAGENNMKQTYNKLNMLLTSLSDT